MPFKFSWFFILLAFTLSVAYFGYSFGYIHKLATLLITALITALIVNLQFREVKFSKYLGMFAIAITANSILVGIPPTAKETTLEFFMAGLLAACYFLSCSATFGVAIQYIFELVDNSKE